MPVSKNFKNIIFFFKFATSTQAGGAWGQGACRPPPSGDRTGGLSPPGDRSLLLYISILPSFPPHLSPKIPPKIQKKREG